MFASLKEYEAPDITRALGSGAPLMAPQACLPVLQELDYLFVGTPAKIRALTVAGGVMRDGTSVSGAGRNPFAALTRLAGETAEQLGLRGAMPEPHSEARRMWEDHPFANGAGWVAASDWTGERNLCVPSALLPHDADQTAGFSEGLAAHPDQVAARAHGAMELLERHAVALWWAGAQMAVSLVGAQVYSTARLGPRLGRATLLLDVSCESAVPVVVAASFDSDGGSFCFGAAAGWALDHAANAALRELGAAEFGLTLERSRDQPGGGGDSKWSDIVDRQTFETRLVGQEAGIEQQITRYGTITPHDWKDLMAELEISFVPLGQVGGHFQVAKAVCPNLQSGRETYVTAQLAQATKGNHRAFEGALY
ncbi:YcaO-like family protein [uncultured Tateyamaria sp.]|uniref:YcaO-like family protein n=1 Tax=Tateyamaria sp. 1078 TaxID=3417464 RepID=UPI002637CF6D|nr:YcaO-like family protein [uncultured Tateyamaria sp.]